jgi:hypothetical protein
MTQISLQELLAVGIAIEGMPEVQPQKDGYTLFALITKGKKQKDEFVIPVSDPCVYKTYLMTTKHEGDQGNWLFKKTALFFIPNNS